MKRTLFIVIGFCLFVFAVFLLVSTNASNSYLITKSTPKIKASPTTIVNSEDYINKKYGYGISYPATWVYREFSNGDGVAFQLASDKKDPVNEFITIQVFSKLPGNVGIPFSDYVQTAAANEIQNYQRIASKNPIMTNGITGFETTWNVLPLTGGKTTVSLPITYFPLKNSNKIVEVFLNNKTYLSQYNSMIKTFSYN